MSLTTIKYPKEIIAKKEHTCNYCGEKILPKTKYSISTHVLDDRIYDWKSHLHCEDLVKKLKMHDNTDGYWVTGEDFFETISEEFYTLLYKNFSIEDAIKYKEPISFLRNVNWRDKLRYVIRYYNK